VFLGRLGNVSYVLWPNVLNVQEKEDLLCRTRWIPVGEDLGGLFLASAHQKLG